MQFPESLENTPFQKTALSRAVRTYLIIFCYRNSPIGDGIPVSRSAPKDWDAPELEEDNPEAYEVPHGIKRKRRLIAREDSVSPPPQTLKFGEENEDRWTKKSKIPRLVKV